jgi:hypothetical protein
MSDRVRRIKACLNGRRSPVDHPAVPITPDQLAVAAAEVVAAGAEAAGRFQPPNGWLRILVEIADATAETATIRADEILDVLYAARMAAPILLHGEDESCWPLVAHAGRRGLATRIGLEDVLTGPDGRDVPGNAELVRLALVEWTTTLSG